MRRREFILKTAGAAAGAIAPLSFIADRPGTARADECPLCDGTCRLTCPKCRGTGRFCARCGNSGKTPCERCKGKGERACAGCNGTGSVECVQCQGAGRVWVPRRHEWGTGKDGKKGALIRVIPPHWEDCARCGAKGRHACPACRGTGANRCESCKGTRSTACPFCEGKESRRLACEACDGRGWIRCPRCNDSPREDAAAADRPPDDVLQDLSLASELLHSAPPLLPLLALACAGMHRNPFGIVVFREALDVNHRWIRAMALEELLRFDARRLAEFGGKRLAERLAALGREEDRELRGLAESLLATMARHYPRNVRREGAHGPWRFEPKDFPEGKELPPLLAPADAGDRARSESKGRTRAAPKIDEEAAARRFGAEMPAGQGADIIWTLDCSASVQRSFGNLRNAAARTTRIVAELTGALRVGLVAYRDKVEGLLPLTDAAARFFAALRMLRADKGGDLQEGVDVALRAALDAQGMGMRPEGRNVVVVMGDAGPSPHRARALIAALNDLRMKRPRLSVHCVACGNALIAPRESDFLRDLARAGGGRLLQLDQRTRIVEELCVAAMPGVDETALRRILRTIARTEGWMAEQDRGEERGIEGGRENQAAAPRLTDSRESHRRRAMPAALPPGAPRESRRC